MMNRDLNRSYIVGAYERLSREDDRKEESSSIESQKMIIESFVKFNNFAIYKHYSDDGYTGSNFNRPGFEELKRDIEAKKVNCVIVKDLSRLGRELYLTGSYIEEYFLSKNVRFIAINDGYDSLVGDSMLGIRLSVNDMYLRDTSKKIRSSFDAKRKNGDYIGSFAVYGYMKDPKNPKRLVIDENVAKYVRMMFEWAYDGDGTSTIAGRLTEMKIPVPYIYKNDNRPHARSELNEGNGIWRPQTIKSILTNKMYLGHMIQGRWKKLSYNSKKLVELPESEWFIVENTHEPIIDEKTFNYVNRLLERKKKFTAKRTHKHLLQGLIYCKDCGYGMSILTSKKVSKDILSIQCNNYSKYGKHGICSSHYLLYEPLEADIIAFIREIGRKILDEENIDTIIKNYEKSKIKDTNELNKKKSQLECEIKRNKKQLDILYDHLLEEIIDKELYLVKSKKFKSIIEECEKQLNVINKEIESEKEPSDTNQKYQECKEIITKFFSLEYPTHEMMMEIIDKIEIDKERNVYVYFKADFKRFIDLKKNKGES